MSGETIVTLVGNLTRDPEVRMAGDTPVLPFTIASTPRTFDRNANAWVDGDPLFIDCEAWGNLAYLLAESLYKGSGVIARVELRQQSWTDRQTQQTRTKMVGRVLDIGQRLLVPRGYTPGERAQPRTQHPPQQPSQPSTPQRVQGDDGWWNVQEPPQSPGASGDETPF